MQSNYFCIVICEQLSIIDIPNILGNYSVEFWLNTFITKAILTCSVKDEVYNFLPKNPQTYLEIFDPLFICI